MSSQQQALLVNGGAPPLTYMYLDFENGLTYAKLSGGADASILYPTGTVGITNAAQSTYLPPPPFWAQSANGSFPGSVYGAKWAQGISGVITLGGAFDSTFLSISFDFISNNANTKVECFDSGANLLGSFTWFTGTNSTWNYNNAGTFGAYIHTVVVTNAPSSLCALDNVRFYA